MVKTEKNELEYLSGVFNGFSMERKDYVLNLARSLQEIQNYKIFSGCVDESVSKKSVQMSNE